MKILTKTICQIALFTTLGPESVQALPDAKSMAIMSGAKAQVNKERGKIRQGRQIEFLGSECTLNVAPVDELIRERKPGQKSKINVVVDDIVPVCEAQR